MDSDTVRKPGSHQILQDAFRQGLIDILVGTQMIAKGLDFPNVQLVGVIHADIGLQQPDFRASERTFQLLAQVAGRAGRKEKNGRVLVQTYQPDHPSIALASKHDFLGFAKYELEHRHLLGYPPYQRMARIIIRGLVDQETVDFADQIGRMARNAHAQESVSDKSAFRILGPAPAPVARIENHFRHHLQFQSESPALLHRIIKRLGLVKAPTARVEMAIDIDPQTIL
jgi:primosomal protein N' (replication factor Y)